jgi:ATP-dependent Zn protease
MVGSLGMGGSLVSFDAAAYPGASNLVAKVLGDESARTAVEEILERAKAEAHRILVDHRSVAEALRDALLERDELVGEEILAVIATARAVADLFDLT